MRQLPLIRVDLAHAMSSCVVVVFVFELMHDLHEDGGEEIV